MANPISKGLTTQQTLQMENALDVQAREEDGLMKLANVNMIGVGWIYKDGKKTDKIGLIMNVEKKVDLSALKSGDVVPKEIDGVETDVQEVGNLVKTSLLPEDNLGNVKYSAQGVDYRAKIKPMTTGYSQGNKTSTAGTTGYFAERDGEIGTTSNAHVECSDPSKPMNEQDSWLIMQPGPIDGGQEPERATLKTFVQINANSSVNYVDSAWSLLKDQQDYELVVPEIGVCKAMDYSGPFIGEHIRKVGRTTGLTEEDVNQINVTATVDYGNFKATFKELVATPSMSSGGDSGSIGYVADNKMKYRLFAGSSAVTLFFRLSKEVSKLRLQPLFGGSPQPNPDEVEVNFTLTKDGSTSLYRVYGNVKEQNADPIDGAEVELKGDGVDEKAQTDEHGNYEFKNVEAGSYKMVASKGGFKTEEKDVEIGSSSTTVTPKKLNVKKKG